MNVAIIQARMGSSRLPGKVLKQIKGKSLLEIQYNRLSKAQSINAIVIATTTNKEDDAIEEFCKSKNILVFRGSDWDVLDRYYRAAVLFKATNVVRITSDCPLHHHTVVDKVMNEFELSGKDYFSNSNNEPDFLEDGFDVEVFTFDALKIAWQEAKLLSEREHVTPYIKNSGKFSCGWKKSNEAYTYKLSVDTENDLKAVTAIFNAFDSITDFTMGDVIQLLQQNPEIRQLNADSKINAGYSTSIQNDKKI